VRNNFGAAGNNVFGDVVVTRSNVGDFVGGEGNIDVDPGFVDAGSDDFRLAATSACIDVGQNDGVPPAYIRDLANRPRVVDGDQNGTRLVDMGAYEFEAPCAADWNGAGGLNSQDLFDFLQDFFELNGDFDGNGTTNSQDFFDFVVAFFVGCEG
jgi:hypothetical protein